jgi:hypothetical protein
VAENLGDLFIFISIVAVIVVVGLLLGMLVAGRIDRLMTPRPRAPREPVPPAPMADAEDEQA